jgi:hypothetical protein
VLAATCQQKETIMAKIAFIDIDRVCANGDARFALAEQAKQQVFYVSGTNRDAMNAYWRTAFNADHIALDEPIDGAREKLIVIEHEYDIFFLTSRPENLRDATEEWLAQHALYDGRTIIMKPAVNQFHKTREWKSWTIRLVASMYHATDVLVVDGEQDNLDVLIIVPAPFKIRAYTSLEMKESINLDDIRPF